MIDEIRQKLLQALPVDTPPPSHYRPMVASTITQQIDHTCLQPDATIEQIRSICNEAREYQFYSVCIPPVFLREATEILKNTPVKTITVIGFPLGYQTTETKVFETLDALDWGAQEIDMVINISKLKSGNFEEVYQDIAAVVERAEEIPVKVILETCLLSDQEKIQACILSQLAGASFVKTSTGFGSAGATEEDVRLMRSVVGQTMGVKASGGIRNYDIAKKMVLAGADRLGTSSGVHIAQEENKNKKR